MLLLSAIVVGAAAVSGAGQLAPMQPDTTCPHRNVPIEGRKSPLDSVTFTVSSQQVKVCYGRPSSRGRVMLGSSSI
ncbi:MAG TPA: hypothetical protein VE420_17660, partial [Gemmatimonadales bacterium]|nr:hypothetical protein [Gemmatimonadales bacterium]